MPNLTQEATHSPSAFWGQKQQFNPKRSHPPDAFWEQEAANESDEVNSA